MRPSVGRSKTGSRVGAAVAASVAAMALTVTAAHGAVAEPRPDEDIKVNATVAALIEAYAINSYELMDLQMVAAQNDLSLEQAIARFAWNDEFAALVADVREQFPDDFAGAAINEDGNPWIAFNADVPAAARALINTPAVPLDSVDIDLRTGTGFTELVLQEEIETLHFALLEQPGIVDLITSFDDETLTFEVVASVDGALRRTRTALAAQALGAEAQARIPGSSLEFNVVVNTELVHTENSSAHYGGELITQCTSGFATRDTSSTAGTRGMVTAGHCPNTQSDDGANLPFVRGHEGTHGDFQLHRGSQALSNRFYAGSATATEVNPRSVTAVGSPTVGQSLCRNGRSTQANCQQVRRVNVCAMGVCNMVQMGEHRSAGGDSGGPIYWSNTAFGVHMGMHYDPVWPASRELFSRADRMPQAIQAHVATN